MEIVSLFIRRNPEASIHKVLFDAAASQFRTAPASLRQTVAEFDGGSTEGEARIAVSIPGTEPRGGRRVPAAPKCGRAHALAPSACHPCRRLRAHARLHFSAVFGPGERLHFDHLCAEENDHSASAWVVFAGSSLVTAIWIKQRPKSEIHGI